MQEGRRGFPVAGVDYEEKTMGGMMTKGLVMLLSLLCGVEWALAGQNNPLGPEDSLSGSTWTVALDGSGQFQSIQEAIDHAQPGDTVWIKAGRYEEDVTIHSKERIKVLGEGMDLVTLVGLKRVGTLHLGKWPYGVTDLLISGMTIHQHGGLGIGIFNGGGIVLKKIRVEGMVFAQQVQKVHLEDCVIGGSETTGVAFVDSQGTLVGNFIHDNDHGVTVGGTSRVRLEHNVITRSLFEAVLVTNHGQATLVRNTLVGNGGGVRFRDESTGDIRGNIIGESKVGLVFSPKSHTRLSLNALYHNGQDYVLSGSPNVPAPERQGHTDVHLAPRFVAPDRDDFRLKADSPLIQIGNYSYLGALGPAEE